MKPSPPAQPRRARPARACRLRPACARVPGRRRPPLACRRLLAVAARRRRRSTRADRPRPRPATPMAQSSGPGSVIMPPFGKNAHVIMTTGCRRTPAWRRPCWPTRTTSWPTCTPSTPAGSRTAGPPTSARRWSSQVRGVLSGQDVTTESFKGTIRIFDMTVIHDPDIPADVDVSGLLRQRAGRQHQPGHGGGPAGPVAVGQQLLPVHRRAGADLVRPVAGRRRTIRSFITRRLRSASRETPRRLDGRLSRHRRSWPCRCSRWRPAARSGRRPARPDGTLAVNCPTGSSCYIQLEQMIHFGGDYSPGADNMVVDIQPPPCLGPGRQRADRQPVHRQLLQRRPLRAPDALRRPVRLVHAGQADGGHSAPPRPGEVVLPAGPPNDTAAQAAAVRGRAAVVLRGARRAAARHRAAAGDAGPARPAPRCKIPAAGRMYLSPRTGNTYSNLPTFARVTLQPALRDRAGRPALRDGQGRGSAATGATVWVEATPLQLATNDSSATLGNGPAAATWARPRWSATRGRWPVPAPTARPTAG